MAASLPYSPNHCGSNRNSRAALEDLFLHCVRDDPTLCLTALGARMDL